ncbi:uncharacterized protein F5Z01DRAFT_139756 [Emericellopsis atlantica]|uniref:DUF1993 domain-containing protein n=1 Tax=Emericellopsis atlantica TaxID=2614577 RepID=A0A9P7ZKN4_9HYPO|nr:uncharacterized protein F5Z01DRAFT_139756 [Emericellopsis atlantica]KAG9253461.1 hypothetical protein F5Z01DRAFT_139756 [Emericellopsis atlantica]
MASSSFYDMAIGTVRIQLEMLSTIIAKAEASPMAASIPQARIHEDMLPFTFQVDCATHTIHRCLALTSGQFPMADDEWPFDSTTYEQIKARIAKAEEQLAIVDKDKVNARENEVCEWSLARGTTHLKATALEFVRDYVIPNTYFHVVTAYDIARKQGVELSKRDYIVPGLGKHVISRTEG